MSEQRACRARKSVRYRSTRDDDAGPREKLRELANQRRPFGYRRTHILLRREGIMIDRKKTQRLDKEEGVAVRRRLSRRCAVGTRALAPAEPALGPRVGPSALLQFATNRFAIRLLRAGGSACSTWSMM